MNRRIARFNCRIMIQKHTTVTDKYLNHKSAWVDYYSCSAYAGTYQSDKESSGDVTTKSEQTISFDVRYCSELKGVKSNKYRVVFNGDVYDIVAVDMMNYQRQTITLRCEYQEASK